uniref:Uncharacterized protein n=1 Tax=Cucumis sativus TaxID=3659 RepID=A0A0A0LRT5_CUCSA
MLKMAESALETYGHDLAETAEKQTIDPIFRRRQEIRHLRRRKNSYRRSTRTENRLRKCPDQALRRKNRRTGHGSPTRRSNLRRAIGREIEECGDDGRTAAEILKPALWRGNFRCIGATTLKEYKRYIGEEI